MLSWHICLQRMLLVYVVDWPCKKSQVVNLNLIKAYYSITRALYILFSLQLQSPPILTSLTVTGINTKNGKSAKTLGMV